MLDYYRATFVMKCADLSDDELSTRAIPPSNLSLLGVLRHLAEVEVYWFGYVFAGLDVTYAYDPEMIGADFDNPAESPGESVVERFYECVTESTELTRDKSLDSPSVRPPDGETVNLRYIVVHLIEEYARHCGHADLLREVIDGETGD
jgi:uncharacterized damage-inducible protein DinB